MAFAWKMTGERKACDFMDFQHHTTILANVAAYSSYPLQITTAWKMTGVRKACDFMDFQHHTSILATIAIGNRFR